MLIDTHYDTLNVTQDAPDWLIRAVYLALARKYHPDRNLTNPEAMRMMQLINIAYQALNDQTRRAEHDAWIKQHAPPPVPREEKNASPQTAKAQADIDGWLAIAARADKDTQAAKARADKAQAQAAAALDKDKAKWHALGAQAAQEEQDARAKTEHAQAQARDIAQKAGISLACGENGGASTHYHTLHVSLRAPVEVIRAAYKAHAQQYAAEEQQAQAATAGIVQTLNEAYKVLTDADKKAAYDARIGNAAASAPATAAARSLTAKENELNAAAERATAIAKAKAALADRLHEEAQEAAAQAQQAAQAAEKKSADKDALKWKAWADKLHADAQTAKAKAQKEIADAEAAKAAAQEATARAHAEKAMADKLASADAESHARNRAIREAAERAEHEKHG